MDNRLKRFLSLAMAIIMVIGLMPANIVFATENEGDASNSGEGIMLLGDIVDDNQETSEPDAPVVAAACVEGCMLEPNHTGDCVVKCSKFENCKLETGHTGDCLDANDQILVNPSSVISAAGLVAAIGNGGTIKLAENITLSAAIEINNTVTLDLNGKSITVAAPAEDQPAPEYALINKGTLTVKGNGSVAGIMNEGTLTVENGTVSATGAATYAVYNKGTATINGGTFNAAGGAYAVYNDSAKQMTFKDASVNGVYNASGILTVNSGNFNGNSGAPAVYSMGGSLTIKGGEFHNNQAGVATVILGDTCAAEITGGTITNEAQAPALSVQTSSGYGATISGAAVIKSGIAVADGATLTVNGGTFQDAGDNNFSAGATAVVKVNGGTYEDENSQNFAAAHAQDGKILIFKEGDQEVKKVKSAPGVVSDVIATTGSGAAIVGHPTLAGAVAVGGTVDMVADTVLTETVEVSKTVILNLNECTISADFPENGAIYVKVGGSLTVNGTGSINTNLGNAVYNQGTLVVNGGSIDALINGDPSADTATATLNGGTFGEINNKGRMTISGATVGSQLDNYGVFEMTGGYVENLLVYGQNINPACGLSTTIKGGKVRRLESRDGEYTRYGNVVTIEAGEGNTIPEVEIVCAIKAENAETKSRIDIKNGKIGSVDAYRSDTLGNRIPESPVAGMISITGGTFTARPDDVHVKDGYEVVDHAISGATVYIVQLKKVVLKDPTGTDYTNLLDNNGAGTSITKDQVLNDIKENENLKTVTNESGYTLIITPKKVVIEAGDPYKTSRITYSVYPEDLNHNKISDLNGKEITFNLPIPGTLPEHVDYANVYHGNDKMTGPETDGAFEIKGEGNKRFVTVTSGTFSEFTVEIIDVDYFNHVAKIGVKGYTSVQAAVDAVRDGETIELLALPEKKVYGSATINLGQAKSFTIDGSATINNAPAKRAWYYDGGATITFTGVSPEGETVTIKNIEFNRVNKTTGEFIKVDGSYYRTHVVIENCDFTGPGSNSDMVAIRTSNSNGVVIDGGTASGLKAFLENVGGSNLTVKNVTIKESNVGMELGAVQGVAVEGVTITSTVGKYGISMDASVNNNAVFTSCNITAAVPVMVYGSPKTSAGRITFNGASTMNASSGYWIILADEKYSEKPEGTSPESLSATGRIVITVTDAGLKAENINDKHKDESDANVRKYYTVAPKGRLDSAVVKDDASTENDSHITYDIRNLVASERIVLEVYDKTGTKIAVSKLVNMDVLYLSTLTGTVGISRESNSWETTWLMAEKCPIYRNVPATAKLIVDGKVLSQDIPVHMYDPVLTATKRVWTDVEGVGNLTMNDVWYHTLAEALEATRKAGAAKTHTVKLYDDNTAILSAKGEITGGKEVTITTVDYKGDGITPVTLDWGDTNTEYLFVGRGSNTGDGKLIFDGAHITAAGNTPGAIGIHVSGAKKNSNDTVCNGTLVVQNGSNVELDYLVNRNDVTVTGKDTTLVVRNGFASGGRHESEARDDAAKISTLTVENHATLIIRDMTGKSASQHEGLGYEGVGQMLVDNATFAYEGEFHNAVETGKMQVSGTSTLKLEKIYKGTADSGITKNVVFGAPIELLDGTKLVYSTVDGEVFANGTADEKIEVSFNGTQKINTVNVNNGTAIFTTKNKIGDVTVNNGVLKTDGTNNFNSVSFEGTANITGTTVVTNNISVAGELYTNTESTITAKKINLETDEDKVVIDAAKLNKEEGVKVIDQSNNDYPANSDALKGYKNKFSVAEDKAAKQVADDGDVFIYFEAYIDNDGDKDLDIGEGYATIEKAVEEAAKDKTVILLADADVEAPVVIDKNIVLDLNTKEIKGTETRITVLKVTASDATVKNGIIDAYYSTNTGIEVVKADAANAPVPAVNLIGVEVKGHTAGIKASGNVTVGAGTVVTARYELQQAAIIANGNAAVTIDGGTVGNTNTNRAIVLSDTASVIVNGGKVGKDISGSAIELNDAASATINGGEVIGAPAVRVNGGTLTVNGGKVTRKHATANAIVTSPNSESGRGVSRVVIKNGEITGPIIAEDVAQNVVVPNDYKVSLVIEGGNFTASGLDENYVKKDYVEIAVSRAKADVPTTFDNFVPFEMIVPDFTCQKVKDSNPVKYEIVPYEHVRIYMNNVDDGDLDGDGRADYKIFVGDDAYVDGDAYEVQPGKVLLISKDLAKKSEMFITTYAYNDNETPEVKKDDYPEAMYVWYAKGKTKVGNTYTAYDVERVAELDNFFLYNGTSIRVGGSSNGIRFFSSVDAGDANKLMNGSLIDRTDSVLYEAEMTAAGTQFWKTEDNKLQSEVFGGTVGAFRVFQQYQGRNWFTGVLVGLDTDGKTIVDSIYSRPYAAIKVGDKTVNLYGGILDRSIYLVAEQNKDVFTDGSSYDKFVEDLIVKGDEYLASLNNNNNSGTGSEGGTGTGTTGNS